MKKLFGLFFAGVILAGCQTAGGIAQTVGGKFTDYSNKQESGIVKTATGVAGSAYTTVGNAVAPKKVETAKATAAVATKAPAKKAPSALQKVKTVDDAVSKKAGKTGM